MANVITRGMFGDNNHSMVALYGRTALSVCVSFRYNFIITKGKKLRSEKPKINRALCTNKLYKNIPLAHVQTMNYSRVELS